MTMWEKAVVNMQKGAQKITAAAAVFSERVKAEIVIVRLKLRIAEVQERINELYRAVGRRVVELSKSGGMPKTGEQVLKDEDIAAALSELSEREQELEDLKNEIKSGLETVNSFKKQTEDAGL